MTTPLLAPARPRPQPTKRRARPNAPVQRLESLNTPPRFVSTSPAPPRSRNVCPYPDCGGSNLQEDNGSLYCADCARMIDEASPYVSDPQFTETASGAAQLQGQYIAADQSHPRLTSIRGRTGPHQRGIGTEARSSSEKTREAARARIAELITLLRLPSNLETVALGYFQLAQRGVPSGDSNMVHPADKSRVGHQRYSATHNFLAGRELKAVAACCLYIACRKRTTPPRDPANVDVAASVMLIDFAELIVMDVFLLGKTFTQLVRHIWGDTDPDTGLKTGQIKGDHRRQLLASPPESLVERFVSQLEFDKKDHRKIKLDAVNVIRRMKRDWMHYGRRPAGICGAAIILAARMNNYRRTVREVVLVAKVTEITINKRLEEFAFTDASGLTVEGFRDDTVRESLSDADPPSYYVARGLGPDKKKRGRPRKRPLPEAVTAAEIEGNVSQEDEGRSTKRVRFDEDGFRIPDLPTRGRRDRPEENGQLAPIDPEILARAPDGAAVASSGSTQSPEDNSGSDEVYTGPATRTRAGRGRPPGSKNKPPRTLTERELQLEKELEGDVRYGLGLALNSGTGSRVRALAMEIPQATTRDETATPASGSNGATTSVQVSAAKVTYTDNDRDSDDRPNDVEEDEDDPTQDSVLNPSLQIETAWNSTPDPRGPAVNTDIGNTGLACSMSPTLAPGEFSDDSDVADCLLSEAEMRIKERIWVTENADWLRRDNEKKIRRAVREMRDRLRDGGDPGTGAGGGGITAPGRPSRRRRKKRAGRIGDVRYLDESSSDEDDEGGHSPTGEQGEADKDGDEDAEAARKRRKEERRERRRRERSATEAMEKMLARRAPSRRVNYQSLEGIYGRVSTSTTSTTGSASPSQTRSPSLVPARDSVVPSPRSTVSTTVPPPIPTPPITQPSPRGVTVAARSGTSSPLTPVAQTTGSSSGLEGEEEMLGSIDDDDEQVGGSEGENNEEGEDDDEDEEEEEEDDDDDEGASEDDYVADVDIDAVFEGRRRRRG